MYVIDYTAIAGGQAYQVRSTTHWDAVQTLITDQASPFSGNFPNAGANQYMPTDGEQITIVGPTQDAFRDGEHHDSIGQRLLETIAGGGKGVRTAQSQYRAWQAKPRPKVEHVAITFTIRARTVFDAVELERPEAEPEPEEATT